MSERTVHPDALFGTSQPKKWPRGADSWCPACHADVCFDMAQDDTDPEPDEDFAAKCWQCGAVFTTAYWLERSYGAGKVVRDTIGPEEADDA